MSKLAEASIIAFIYENSLKTETGKPLSFDDRQFLYDIYRDWSPKQVVLKAAQIGFSTEAIIKTIWGAKHKGIDIVYTLPTDNDVRLFAGGKINRIISLNPILQQYVKERDTVEQKTVGERVIYYRGTKSGSAAIMVSADLLVHDEEDRSDQKIISTYASRLQASDKKWEWHFSNPSVPGNGVSRYWNRSTQSEWFVRCEECNKEQFLEWPDNVDKVRKIFVCKFCDVELINRRDGRWVDRFKEKEFKGYHISLLMAPWVTAQEILDYHETKPADYFANFVLGLPYIGQGNTVTPDIILRNCTSFINEQDNVVIGCDSGIIKHYVIGNRQGLFYYDKTEDWDDIGRLLKKYKRSIAVIDAMPDITGPRKLREEFPGRVFLCHYAQDRKTLQLIRWGEGEEAGNVTVDRNRALQFLIDEFADSRVPLQGTEEDWANYVKHWETLYRISDVDKNGSPTFKWETSTGMDHYAHASLYWRTGMEKVGIGDSKFVMGSTEQKEFPAAVAHADGRIEYEESPLKFRKKGEKESWYNLYD